MDIFAHGAWAGAASIAAGRTLRRRIPVPWAMLWGVFPDLAAFTPVFVLVAWLRWIKGLDVSGRFFIFGSTARETLPVFLRPNELYHYSHSLIFFSLVFGSVWLVRRRPALPMLAWPLHILMDIPTHRAGMYGTPFLWPLSSYLFDGISWAQPWFMVLNWSAIAAAYVALLLWHRIPGTQSGFRAGARMSSRTDPRS